MGDSTIRAGDGLMVHERGGQFPGTVLRVSTSGRCVWYRRDPEGGATVVPGREPWVYRAFRQPDGMYRDDKDMWRVELGVRRSVRPTEQGIPPAEAKDLPALEAAVERIEPFLLKRRWYPMTYMMIPTMLQNADGLIAAVDRFPPADEAERVRKAGLLERITALRRGFRREMPMEMSDRNLLDAAYRATTFVAELPGGRCEIRLDRRHPLLDAALSAAGAAQWAYLTAWNPGSVDMPDEVNRAAHARLEAALAAPGPFFRGTSRPDSGKPGEESVLAFVDRATAEALGRRFQQNAIVVGVLGGPAELVWLV